MLPMVESEVMATQEHMYILMVIPGAKEMKFDREQRKGEE